MSGREPYPREFELAGGFVTRQPGRHAPEAQSPSAMEGCHAVLLADRGPDRPRVRAGVGTLLAFSRLPGASSGQCPQRLS